MTVKNYIKIQLELMQEQIENWKMIDRQLKLMNVYMLMHTVVVIAIIILLITKGAI